MKPKSCCLKFSINLCDGNGVIEFVDPERGIVDGVTRENTLTEDGLNADISEQLINDLRKIVKN